MKSSFLYTPEYFRFDYGHAHPLKIVRLLLTHELCRAYGLLDLPGVTEVATRPASEEEVLSFHTRDYLDMLRSLNEAPHRPEAFRYGIGPGDNPHFPGVYDWSLLASGASLQAARAVAEGRARVAFNIAGGLHHAMADRASGFCYLNDPVLAILELLESVPRVLYVDIDAHHGDGVQAAFYKSCRVLTLSIHQDGHTLFPGTGFVQEIGEAEGKGFSVNVPLPPGAGDDAMLAAFEGTFLPLIQRFQPSVLVTQLGVDTFAADPLSNLNLTTHGFTRMVRAFRQADLPWVALGGGGYYVPNVARGWALAWAIMNDVDLSDPLPEGYRLLAEEKGFRPGSLHDPPLLAQLRQTDGLLEVVQRIVAYLEAKVFPLVEV